MKRLIAVVILLFSSLIIFAQNNKDIAEASFKVEGNCDMCKKRIESAAYIKGVKRAEWNKETQQINVVYRPSKTNKEEIQKSIAKAGHSTEKVQATEEDYKNLPECCQYKTNSCEH